MNNLVKLLIIAGLAIGIFGGGGYLAYRLFFKKADKLKLGVNHPVVTPTPDAGVTMFEQANHEFERGEKESGKKILWALIQNLPDSEKNSDAKKLLGSLNVREFFSTQPGPDKTEYVVARGDSMARIAGKTKCDAELIFKANGLDSLTIQPGQKFIIPRGEFSLLINLKKHDLTLLKKGAFFRWYEPLEFKIPAAGVSGQYKVREKIAWSAGTRVAFGEKNYLGSSRWIVISSNGTAIYSETNPQSPNAQKPANG
ncbi:MAG TPA: LysM peptidoglycan-binding domain-containing protein, partial [Chthoniobacterales bacterium]